MSKNKETYSNKVLKILALEPYYGGSHKAFLDTWIDSSVHEWTLLTLKPRKWKWRMMHSAVTFAHEIMEIVANTAVSDKDTSKNSTFPWDIILCTDMLDLAQLRGLLPAEFAHIPTVAYFHENQITYPTKYPKERDRHFALSNIITALSADYLWFNSYFHKDEFIEATAEFAKKAPDYKPLFITEQIRAKAEVVPQGINNISRSNKVRIDGPVRITWAHRWEFDKDPETFFKAISLLRRRKYCDFRISVIGGKSSDDNELFRSAKEEFADIIDHWGYVESYDEYCNILSNSDIAVSTAIHEFFGIGIAEAVSAGAFPVVPKRLAYPEILAENESDIDKISFFYEGNHRKLADHLFLVQSLISHNNSPWEGDPNRAIRKIENFFWDNLIPQLDSKLEQIVM